MKRETKRDRERRFYGRMADAGFTVEETDTLIRAERTLHRWAEAECGDSNAGASWAIERDGATGKPYRAVYPHSGKSYRVPIADRERGALRRVAKLLASHPAYTYYHQSDPRGCALYIVLVSALADGASIDSVYNRGIAICY